MGKTEEGFEIFLKKGGIARLGDPLKGGINMMANFSGMGLCIFQYFHRDDLPNLQSITHS